MLFLRGAKGLKGGRAGLAQRYLGCEVPQALSALWRRMGMKTILSFHLVPERFIVRIP